MYTKDPCQLCEEAREALQSSRLWNRFQFQEIDISLPENRKWYGTYRFDIPVFHLNGKFLMKHRVDLSLLEQRLAEC